jgi:broad specificity phosphatase PhoE
MTKNTTKYCTFYITRHGETVWNRQQRMQGHLDSPLTENGIAQAKQTAQKLKEIVFDHAFSSDLLRAKRTAEIIAADHDLVVKTSKLIRESTLGPFEGKKLTFFRKALQKSLDYRESLSSEERMSYSIHPGVETYEETALRMMTFLREVAVAYPRKNVLVVSHAAIIRASLVKLGFATDDELPHGSIDNAGYAVVESDGVDFFVRQTEGVHKVKIE